MEPNRLWHAPEVVIYSAAITPGTRCQGHAYDLANRRWYEISLNSDTYDEEWMANIVETHISSYYHTFGKPTPFNVIIVSKDQELQFDTQPDHVIARPIRETLRYRSREGAPIPVVSFGCLEEKLYLSRAIDRCRWNEQDCAFKRIEFDCDVGAIDREIKSRETLLKTLAPRCEAGKDLNTIMELRFNVIPILAVVVVEQDGDGDLVVGILMPFGGRSLESLSGSGLDSLASTAGFRELEITRGELRGLARGVRELARAGVVHGDINERNTLRRSRDQEQSRLVLVDFGDIAPEYKNDAFALGELFIWCMERCSWGSSDQRRVQEAARVLKDSGDFDLVLNLLGDDGDGCVEGE